MMGRFFRKTRPSIRITIFSKPECHLCDEAKAVLASAAKLHHLQIEECDISTREDWVQQYADEIPVIFINGRKAFKYRIPFDALIKKLRAVEKADYS